MRPQMILSSVSSCFSACVYVFNVLLLYCGSEESDIGALRVQPRSFVHIWRLYRTLLFSDSAGAVCLCEHVVLNMSHFLPHNCSESLFPPGNTVCLHPHPLPPSCPSPACSHVKSWNMSQAAQGGGWKQEGLLDWCPRVWLWVVLPLGTKCPEKIVNSSHFIHVFMNADICAFQSCDCCSVYFYYLLLVQTSTPSWFQRSLLSQAFWNSRLFFLIDLFMWWITNRYQFN